jgi:hypothetical protein
LGIKNSRNKIDIFFLNSTIKSTQTFSKTQLATLQGLTPGRAKHFTEYGGNKFLPKDDFLLTLAYIIAEITVFLFACIDHKSKT